MQGKIIRGIAGFYYVHVKDSGIYECKAKGVFRKNQLKPLVGDRVQIEIIDEEKKKGNIEKIEDRKNQLVRPAVANIDQALVIFSIIKPDPNFNLLDRFLIMMDTRQIPSIICFNKLDIASEEEQKKIQEAYAKSGFPVYFLSAKEEQGLDVILSLLEGKTTAVAGPSGVGKSSVINLLQSGIAMETGEISEKISRGKHTTRHTQLITINEDSYIMDTPGFSSLGLFDLTKEELREYYEEFTPYHDLCKFQGCSHIHEPSCSVKEAVELGEISQLRYDNYKQLYQEIAEQKKY
ncbi:MAG: ribosome small subunit-dependent GTPase A [Eubacteriales bacterium]